MVVLLCSLRVAEFMVGVVLFDQVSKLTNMLAFEFIDGPPSSTYSMMAPDSQILMPVLGSMRVGKRPLGLIAVYSGFLTSVIGMVTVSKGTPSSVRRTETLPGLGPRMPP